MEATKSISAVILAAGFSERMGTEKFNLRFDDTHNFLEKIIETYHSFNCDEIVVTLNSGGIALSRSVSPNLPENVKLIENSQPEKERFYSLQIALKALNNCRYVFVHNIDNPFTEINLLEQLYKYRKEASFVVPVFSGKGGHPILLSEKITDAIIKHNDIQVKLNEFLKDFIKIEVNTNTPSILYNINNPEIYKTIFPLTEN